MSEKSVRATPRRGSSAESKSRPSQDVLKQVQEYVEYLKVPLRLMDWSIQVNGSSFAPDAYADMTSFPDQKRATLRLGEQFSQLAPDEQTQTLVHEMIHCHLFAVHHAFDRVIESAFSSRRAGEMAEHLAESTIETATDALADAFAPMVAPFPLSVQHTPAPKAAKARKASVKNTPAASGKAYAGKGRGSSK